MSSNSWIRSRIGRQYKRRAMYRTGELVAVHSVGMSGCLWILNQTRSVDRPHSVALYIFDKLLNMEVLVWASLRMVRPQNDIRTETAVKTLYDALTCGARRVYPAVTLNRFPYTSSHQPRTF